MRLSQGQVVQYLTRENYQKEANKQVVLAPPSTGTPSKGHTLPLGWGGVYGFQTQGPGGKHQNVHHHFANVVVAPRIL